MDLLRLLLDGQPHPSRNQNARWESARGYAAFVGPVSWLHNQSHGIADHLFRSRYLSVLIESDEQLISVIRYIARNPLRGGLVERAEDWPWASYPALLGKDKPIAGFEPAETLAVFSDRPWLGRAALRGLVEDDNPRRDRWPAVSLANA